MKKMKWLGATGAILAIGAAGFVAAPSANGAAVVVTATHGTFTCSIAGAAKLNPPLKNDWDAADHANDASTAVQTFKKAVASIPSHTYSSVGPVSTTASISTVAGSCSGTATDDNGHTVHVASAKLSALSVSGDNTKQADCAGLATAGGGGGDDPQTFDSTIAWTTQAGDLKMAPTTVHATLANLTTGGTGFALKAGVAQGGLASDVTGSFGGGSSLSKAYIDGTALTALTIATFGLHGTFADPTASGDICEPPMSIKSSTAADVAGALTSDAIAIKVKAPKGLKQIVLGNTALQGCTSSCNDSTIQVTHS